MIYYIHFYQQDFIKNIILILNSETIIIMRLLKQTCDFQLTIKKSPYWFGNNLICISLQSNFG